MTELILIRHGKTRGNLEGRYVGKTDEALCVSGEEALSVLKTEGIYPHVSLVCSSPMKRCLETASIIYGNQKPYIIEEFRETDFGVFEYKNYAELNGDPIYQSWIDSNGTMDIPEAESALAFEARIRQGSRKLFSLCQEQGIQKAACVVHGGVIMKFMSLYGYPKEDYYHWQVKNGKGIRVWLSDNEEKAEFIDWI